MAMYGVHVEVN